MAKVSHACLKAIEQSLGDLGGLGIAVIIRLGSPSIMGLGLGLSERAVQSSVSDEDTANIRRGLPGFVVFNHHTRITQ